MDLEQAQAVYAEALEQMKDGTLISAMGAQQAAIDLQNAEAQQPTVTGDARDA
jgi:hypothetical protein